ncbi:MAG: hypothetical protein ACOYM7_10230 [Paludibacter sp.]
MLAIIVVIAACKSALYMPSSNNTAKGADISKLQQGRELYINKCGSCHTLFAPEKYNKTDWAKWVNRMAPKAKLTEEQKVLVQAYLTKGE